MNFRSWITWKGKDIGYGFLSELLWPRSSAAVLVVEGGELLAIDTGEYLMLPGGGLEKGETFEEAAVREVEEETGLQVELKERIEDTVNSIGGPEAFFLAEMTGGELESYWEGEPVWIGLEEVEERRWRHNRDPERLLEDAGVL